MQFDWERFSQALRRQIAPIKSIRGALLPENPFHPKYLELKSVFIHVPKAAGNSVTMALYGLPSDRLGGHRRARAYFNYDAELAASLFFFAFVRNPYDRFHSAYYFLKAGGMRAHDRRFCETVMSRAASFRDFVGLMEESPAYCDAVRSYHHFWPQTDFLCDADGRPLVQKIAYYENFDAEMDELCRRFAVANRAEVVNRTGRKEHPLDEDFDARAVALVRRLYAGDFALLGYDEDFSPDRLAAPASSATLAVSSPKSAFPNG